jgi:adenylyltransferase/sulfurtransferase
LSPAELARYSRHLVLPEVGVEGQARLKAARVVLVGAGGLGSPLGLYLAAAGVGRIGLVDFDKVDVTNLQRQVLYGHRDVGRSKVETACTRLRDLNPHAEIEVHETTLTAENAAEILTPYDLVIDGTDNFATRYLVNDACVLLKKPNVYGSVYRFEGQVSVFWADRGPCYRCLFSEPPPPGQSPSCAEGGVLGVLPGTIGTLQATEAIKVILDRGDLLVGRLLHYDALASRFHTFQVPKDPACPVCGERPTITSIADIARACGAMDTETPISADDVTPAELKARLDAGASPCLVDVRTDWEWRIGHLAGASHIPIVDLATRHPELDRTAEIVLYCKRGVNSVAAMRFLQQFGFTHVRHLRGGLDAWKAEVDPAFPAY